MMDESLQQLIREHLAWWGLRHYTSDREYFAWQQQAFSSEDLKQLQQLVERKRSGDRRDEVAFYDATAQDTFYPVLYSQRYEYYEAIGLRAVTHLGEATDVLDVGCGPGILTTFYARQFPEKTFVGVDRSSASIALAQRRANEQGLRNVRFHVIDFETETLPGSYALIIATHALLQAEHDPGVPSQSWQTFERTHLPEPQLLFEQRTGLAVRLDQLCRSLSEDGRMIVFEKTRQLARRVPFQRALAKRGFQLARPPEPLRYRSIEEVADDGPFYVVQQQGEGRFVWDESPEQDDGQPFTRDTILAASMDPNVPLYENHWPSAQLAWEQLEERQVIRELTSLEADGRQVHVESGKAEGFHYIYCANTFDQRQLVIIEPARSAMLDTYYKEISNRMPQVIRPL